MRGFTYTVNQGPTRRPPSSLENTSVLRLYSSSAIGSVDASFASPPKQHGGALQGCRGPWTPVPIFGTAICVFPPWSLSPRLSRPQLYAGASSSQASPPYSPLPSCLDSMKVPSSGRCRTMPALHVTHALFRKHILDAPLMLPGRFARGSCIAPQLSRRPSQGRRTPRFFEGQEG